MNMASPVVAVVDGNNFYYSCEAVWRPSLKNHPVVVLSNNDGCAIARSNEAKALGIKMGQPWFECRQLAEEHGVVALSANFTLYGSMSERMMNIAAALGPAQEIYSIDECFIDLTGVQGNLTARGEQMRSKILQWIGIPTGVGIGTTKTLAKLANHIAKSADRKPGSYPGELARVCNLASLPSSDLDAVLHATDVGEVWGVGRRIGDQLKVEGIETVLDLVQLDPAMVRRRWSVVLERTVRELQGQQCISLDNQPGPKKEIAFTRSFGGAVTELEDLIAAVTRFTSGAAVKLRAQGSKAGQLLVFAHTSAFRPGPKYSRSLVLPLRRATDDTVELVNASTRGIEAIYRPGFNFAKAGVMLLDLQDGQMEQGELDLEPEAPARGHLMATLDKLNDRYGRGTVTVASAGVKGPQREFEMKQNLLTPQYTTSWSDLPVAKA